MRATPSVVHTAKNADPTESDLVCAPYDMEKVLPIAAIREFTNTDDVPHFTNYMLDLYRASALEAAQEYTGLLLSGRQTITEIVEIPLQITRNCRNFNRGGIDRYGGYGGFGGGAYDNVQVPNHAHYTKYRFAQDTAIYFGIGGRFRHVVNVEPGTNRVELEVVQSPFGDSCCDPKSTGGYVSRLMYVAGFADECLIPAPIKLGALKYIAHVIENSGDIVMTTTAGSGSSSGGNADVSQSNNPALASGAIDIWSTVVSDRI